MAQIAEHPSTLPAPIRRALRRVDARLRLVASARGLGLATLAAALALGASMAADFAWPLPMAARWGIWGASVGVVGVMLAGLVLRPLLRRARAIDLAAVAERGDPALGERWTGSVALLDRDARPDGSPGMVAALAREAAEHAPGFRASSAVDSGPAWRRVAAGVIASGLVAAPSLARPDPFRTLALRSLAPWLDLERVGRFAVTVEPGDMVAAIGSDFRVSARVAPRFGSTPPGDAAWLEWSDASGATRRVRMASRPGGDPASSSSRDFEATVPRLAASLTYRVAAGSARSRSFRVTAVEPPAIASLAAWVEPPAYTGLAAGPAGNPGRIEAVEGSRIVLEAATTSPVGGVDLAWPVAPAPAAPLPVGLAPLPGGRTWAATVEAVAGGTFTLTPRRDRHGIDGRAGSREVVVRADAPPTLAVQGPGGAGESRPDDVLPVGVAARDDFAVAAAELHYEVRRAGERPDADPRPGRVDLPLVGLGTPTARGVGSLPLRPLDLRPGDSVTYRVRVADNRPAPRGPNVAWSRPESLRIAATAEPMLARRDRAVRESFAGRLEEIRKANAANRREVEQLRYAADAAGREPDAWGLDRARALAAREAEARAVADRLQLLARDVEASPQFAPLARPARQAADVEGEAARSQLDKARRAEPAHRLAEIRRADARLGSFGGRLDELRRRFEALARLDGDRQKLRDLAARQDELADRAGRPDADAARLAAEEDAVRRDLDALVAKSPGLRAEVLAAGADEAARLAQGARELAEKQRSEARKTAEAARGDAPMRELAREQRALEDDARRLALDVDEPLAEDGRARVDTDALRRAAEPIERGELPEGARRMEEAEDSLRRLARDVEDVPADPKALARRLARRQEVLAGEVNAALAEARKEAPPPGRPAATADRFKPLLARQEAIAGLAAAIAPPEPQKPAAREAAEATGRAAETLRSPGPRQAEEAQDAAKRALNRLADALADPNRLREESRRKLDEARRKEEEVAREIDRALAETAPKPDKLDADARAATDLAERIAPLARKQEEAAAALLALDVEPRARPQRDRAAARAADLAGRIKAVRAEAPPRRPDPKPQAASGWHVAGPFRGQKAAPPFDPARPVDLGATVDLPDGRPARPWKPAPASGDEGKVDLGQIYSRDDNQQAFAVAEVASPARRRATLSIGSDDSLILWLNGRPVYSFEGNRSCNPGQDKVEVELAEGVNRLALRCATGNGDWGFAIAVSPPPPEGFDPSKARALREALAAARADATTSADRLEQKSRGKQPADDLAAELAAEQRAAAEQAARDAARPPEDDPTPRDRAAGERRRVATALRNLDAPDAPALRAEAVRLAEAAAGLGAAADPGAIMAAEKAAAEAGEALARRLADDLGPRARAAALARAERALDPADPARLADAQKAIAAELGRRPSAARAEGAVRRAADLAEKARQPNPSRPPAEALAELAAARAEAATALDAMAADPALGPDPSAPAAGAGKPDEPAAAAPPADADLGLGADQAARAADLARRQRQIRERLQAAMGGRVAPQEDLRRESSALAGEIRDLRDRAREVNARDQGQANAAADLLGEHAPRQMDRSAEQLAQGRLDQARESQRQAADLVERAARESEDLAAGLRAEGAAEAGATPASPSGLADARATIRQLAGQLAPAAAKDGRPAPAQGQAQAAAPAMHRAADSLRAAAQGPGAQGPPMPGGEPGPDNPDPVVAAAGAADPDLAALRDLVREKSGRRWGELPGHLQTEILQLSKGRYRDDYARLIQLYFREIAADAGNARGGKP